MGYNTLANQWRIQGGHMGHGPPLGAWGHQRPGRGTTVLAVAPQTCQEHHRPSNNTTGLTGPPEACQEHHGPVGGISGLSWAPQSGQGPGAPAD